VAILFFSIPPLFAEMSRDTGDVPRLPARMYGDMQGIIGASLPEIKSLELKSLTDETEVIKTE